jgi:hypothetical protein
LALVFAALSCLSFSASAGWSCTTSEGHTYISSQRVLSDECTNQDTGEVRPPEKPAQLRPNPIKSTPQQVRKTTADGRKAVQNYLKDPESAKFRDLQVNGVTLCGEVNARNTFGGYTGFQKFIAIGLANLVTFDDGSRKFQDDWLGACEGVSQKDIDAFRAQSR